jgi:hypothetical protein
MMVATTVSPAFAKVILGEKALSSRARSTGVRSVKGILGPCPNDTTACSRPVRVMTKTCRAIA